MVCYPTIVAQWSSFVVQRYLAVAGLIVVVYAVGVFRLLRCPGLPVVDGWVPVVIIWGPSSSVSATAASSRSVLRLAFC